MSDTKIISDTKNLSATERIKQKSDGLRGTLREGLRDELTGAIAEDDQALVKFHGMYLQDDRDRREERAEKKLERLFSFMVRLRIPGGLLTPEQWIAIHHVAGQHSTGVIKITTRQTIQLHGILKSHVKPSMAAFNAISLDSIAACGDVNRNVTSTANPQQSPLHEKVHAYAEKISALLLPKTRAWYEVWLDEERLSETTEEDPLYQDRYLPRKFKIGLAIPPNNDVDVLTNDLGLIAIISDNRLEGFNIAIGGGLGATHGNPETYPRLATVIGFVPIEGDDDRKLFKAVYEVVTIQRDYGNRSDRKLARLKYTLDKYGAEWYRQELEKRTGFPLEDARPYVFNDRTERYGWQQDHQGLWHYTLFVENGRVVDEAVPLKTALLEVAGTGKANFRFTVNQKIIIADIKKKDKSGINAILEKYGLLAHTEAASAIRKNSIACVALPTCGLALAESQRYLPSLITQIEKLMAGHDLGQEEIIIRMTGCPNGCGRPYAAEIGFVGTAPGRYNLYLCGDHEGTRLNRLYKENLDENAILRELDLLFWLYKKERITRERFGDFALRQRWYKP
jgi:sulfite reductase (NADPH) hemoprotein beta-component